MKRISFLFSLIFLCSLIFTSTVMAATSWKEISSNGRYGKLFAPATVKCVEKVSNVPTIIKAKIKTTYTYDAAVETINNYEIQKEIPNASLLAYSEADVIVSPQHRTIEYERETFYDVSGKVIWKKVYTTRTEKEINSLSFEEDYYAAIVDVVFRQGEMERIRAKNRWILLWQTTSSDGSSATTMADTSTMRQRGEDSLIYWEWLEKKNVMGQVIEVRFMKKILTLTAGVEKILQGKLWTEEKGWEDIEPSKKQIKISSKGPEAGGLQRMRAFKNGYQYWLNRYRTDKQVKLPKKAEAK